MVYTVNNFIEKNRSWLNIAEISETVKYVDALKTSLTSGNKDQIHKAVDELNEFTTPFAERLMDQAIGHAMKGKSIE